MKSFKLIFQQNKPLLMNSFNLFSSVSSAFVVVTIEKSIFLFYLSEVVGWIYFLTWTISFYPQVYENFKRKSVVGFSFDFLALNIVGFFMYVLFNCGFYWIPEIEVRKSIKKKSNNNTNKTIISETILRTISKKFGPSTIQRCFFFN